MGSILSIWISVPIRAKITGSRIIHILLNVFVTGLWSPQPSFLHCIPKNLKSFGHWKIINFWIFLKNWSYLAKIWRIINFGRFLNIFVWKIYLPQRPWLWWPIHLLHRSGSNGHQTRQSVHLLKCELRKIKIKGAKISWNWISWVFPGI